MSDRTGLWLFCFKVIRISACDVFSPLDIRETPCAKKRQTCLGTSIRVSEAGPSGRGHGCRFAQKPSAAAFHWGAMSRNRPVLDDWCHLRSATRQSSCAASRQLGSSSAQPPPMAGRKWTSLSGPTSERIWRVMTWLMEACSAGDSWSPSQSRFFIPGNRASNRAITSPSETASSSTSARPPARSRKGAGIKTVATAVPFPRGGFYWPFRSAIAWCNLGGEIGK